MEIFELMAERKHEQLVFWSEPMFGYKGIIAIHDTTMGPALGGTRFWNYGSEADALVDALRLARGMTYKAAITGLNLGGGKSVIIGDNKTKDREMIFRAHGRAVDSLKGRYITAEDVGTSPDDMEFVGMETEHVVGVLGGSGDPSPVTAYGAYRGIKACAAFKYGNDSLEGKHVAVQGVGHVGYFLCEDLAAEGAKLTVTDIDKDRVARVVEDFGATAVESDAIYEVEADVFAPCALGAVINDDTLGRMKFDIVAGAANNVLARSHHGEALEKKGILYAPDYVINAGGLINVYGEINEWSPERSKRKAGDIYNTLLRIFERAKADNVPTSVAADRVAESRIMEARQLQRTYLQSSQCLVAGSPTRARRTRLQPRRVNTMMDHLKAADPQIFDSVVAEARRQSEGLELIASENFVSRAVLEAMGTVLTNKYAEGLPHKRYYGGCEHVDVAEDLARDRAKQLFSAEHANVQPHAGAQANMAAYFTFLEPGDKILGMSLSHGGHLTHGSPVNFSGRLFEVVSYGVGDTDGLIDYDALRDQARSEKPKMIVAGASAYPRIIDFQAFGEIAQEVGARLLVDMAHIAGLVATGHHPSPVPWSDVVTTTTHKTLRGPRGGLILCKEEHAKGIDKSVFPFMQGGPLMHIIAAKAVALLEALRPEFKDYSAQIIKNAQALGGALAERGFHLVSGGTDNHLMLVDLRPSHAELTGKDAEAALEAAGITVNKNTVPGETRSPFVTSGLRIGTPALTTRGMKEAEMRQIGQWIAEVLDAPADEHRRRTVRAAVREMCSAFPLYRELAGGV